MSDTSIVFASIRWWARKRPAAWTLEQHLAQPLVNTRGPEEMALAEAVALMLNERKEK